jgi:uncharacterized protein YyaL (SSP411 family)
MTASQSTHTNRLIHSTSPYLLQHAHNPVDWYPWGPEALARAQAEERPILLSVGYSACHWCHVMAHESFEDPETAALMNDLFVNVKVDREERPDIDAIYMEAVQAMTQHGGWPMTVFLTPQGKPFYGGTYFPPEPRYGMPSFRQLLLAIADAWRDRRRELESAGARMTDALNRSAGFAPSDTVLTPGLLDRAAQGLLRSHDRVEGGFGGAPKFPQPMNLDFLLQSYVHTADEAALRAVTLTLHKMAAGGIYDQLGGGFHRYSTDDHWLVPHFEKMLYDNAQLARIYLHAWQITGDATFRRIVEETLDYVLREMTAPEGGFYSTQDADSEGHEGKFFLWTPAEVTALLGPEDARLFCAYHGVTARGNFREGGPGANILNIPRPLEVVAADLGVNLERLAQAAARGRKTLFAAREQRVHPGRDEKILAEWNGLMIHAFAEAGAALDRADYIAAAERAAEFVLGRMSESTNQRISKSTNQQINESASQRRRNTQYASANQQISSDPLRPSSFVLRLFRTCKDGRAHLNAYLEDYAAVGLGLLGLYQTTFELRWLESATELAEIVVARFGDAAAGGFFQTSTDHEQLIARRKDFVDSAVPSGNSLAAELLLRLGKLLDRPDLTERALATFRLLADALGQQPLAFGRLLGALDFHLNPGQEIAIIGDPAAADTRGLLAEMWRRYLPNAVLACAAADDAASRSFIPLLADRPPVDGRATAYVCRNYVCQLPVTGRSALGGQL